MTGNTPLPIKSVTFSVFSCSCCFTDRLEPDLVPAGPGVQPEHGVAVGVLDQEDVDDDLRQECLVGGEGLVGAVQVVDIPQKLVQIIDLHRGVVIIMNVRCHPCQPRQEDADYDNLEELPL